MNWSEAWSAAKIVQHAAAQIAGTAMSETKRHPGGNLAV
jgi:hypothetical protein